jgi:hypothetical protein
MNFPWLSPTDNWTLVQFSPLNSDQILKSKSKSHCDWRSVSQSVSLGVEPHLGLMTRYLLLFDSYGLVSVQRPLLWEGGSVFCICCWALPVQSFSCQVPWDSWPYFTVSNLRLPFSSPPTTCRVTMKVFNPASTRVWSNPSYSLSLYRLRMDHTENMASIVDEACLPFGCLAIDVLLLHASVLRGCVCRPIT